MEDEIDCSYVTDPVIILKSIHCH